MDYSKLTIADITLNPKLLEELKALASSGGQLQKISEQRKKEFASNTFFDPTDAEITFDRLKIKPTLLDDFSLGFLDNIGRVVSKERLIDLIKKDGRAHYLKPIEPAPKSKAEATSTPQPSANNPYVTGNKTQQYLMEKNNPDKAARLKAAAGK